MMVRPVSCVSQQPPVCSSKHPRRAVVVAGERHFSRKSLYYKGLGEPADVVQHVLTLCRRAQPSDLLPFLSCRPVQLPAFASIGSQQVQESGPLTSLSEVLDVGARRVLPGHLLRRSRVLSTLRLGGSFQQRIALTACTGEESVFEWALQQVPGSLDWSSDDEDHAVASDAVLAAELSAKGATLQGEAAAFSAKQGEKQQYKEQLEEAQQEQCTAGLTEAAQPRSAGSSSSTSISTTNTSGSSIALPDPAHSSAAHLAGGSGGDSEAAATKWVIISVKLDGSCDYPLPTAPHPKAAPEAVVKAQLAALERGDIFGASCFNIWRSHSSAQGLGIHYKLLRDKLQEPPFDLLLWHAEAMLGPAVLPSQRVMLQEVVVLGGDGRMDGREGGSNFSSGNSSSSRGWGRGVHGTLSRGSSSVGAGGLGLDRRLDGPSSGRFLWRLGMQANGCWQVTGIEVVETF